MLNHVSILSNVHYWMKNAFHNVGWIHRLHWWPVNTIISYVITSWENEPVYLYITGLRCACKHLQWVRRWFRLSHLVFLFSFLFHPAANVVEILQNIIRNQSVSNTQKMKHLHNFVQVCNENSMISLGYYQRSFVLLGSYLERGSFYLSFSAGSTIRRTSWA